MKKKAHRNDARKDRYKLCPSERSEKGYKMCVYCGQPADTLDHVPPLNRIDDYEAMGLMEEHYLLFIPGPLSVWSCILLGFSCSPG